MKVRYRNWVEGLAGDWLVSRQRFFGVPIPLWYRLDAHGRADLRRARCCPPTTELPVDPSSDVPAGFREDQRGKPGGFIGDPDIMDTWATSSLTPQIAGGWRSDPELWQRVAPMDLRPQAHEIIRTWLFSTVVRSHLEDDRLPFSDVAISGWILDPDRKKMSKSKGNVVTPLDLLDKHGSDGVRYWAASRPAGDGHGVRRGPDEDRPPAGDQDPQRLPVRAAVRRRSAGAARSPSRWTCRCSPGCGKWSRPRPRRWRTTTTPGRWRRPRRSSGRSATTMSSS